MLVETLLERSAANFPEKVALICNGTRLQYAELDRLANRFAHALQRNGVGRGERAVVFLENSAEAVIAIFGILKAGAVIVPLNPSAKVHTVVHVIENCRAKAIVTDDRRAANLFANSRLTSQGVTAWVCRRPAVRDPLPAAPVLDFNGLLLDHRAPSDAPLKTVIDIDLAALLYTSGSSGIPKGVMLTHLNITSAAGSINEYLGTRTDDVILNVLPLAFDYGLYQLFLAFSVGATIVLHSSFAYPWGIIDSLIRESVTGFPIVPTIASMLGQLHLERRSFPHLRYITSTGAVLSPTQINSLRSIFPAATLYSMYGLTECKRVSYLPPDQLDIRPDSVGRGMPNEEVYVIDEAGSRVGPRVVGELVVRGSHVMKGYWELPEETAAVLRAGPVPGEFVLYTGDLFWMDEEGFLYFVGRKDDMIKCCGQRVSPKEVENAVALLDEVAEVAVIGIPDSFLGQAIKAYIVPKSGRTVSPARVLRHCARYLEAHAVPHSLEIMDGLPRSDRGKIDKRALVRAAGATA